MGVDHAREVHILSHARHAMNDEHVARVPLLYAFGRVGDDTPLLAGSTYLIMNRLGSSLSTIVDCVYGGVVPVPIVMNIALQVSALNTDSHKRDLQILSALQFVHSLGYAHNDVKKNNFALALQSPHQLCIYDFGRATPFIDMATGACRTRALADKCVRTQASG